MYSYRHVQFWQPRTLVVARSQFGHANRKKRRQEAAPAPAHLPGATGKLHNPAHSPDRWTAGMTGNVGRDSPK